MGRKSKRFREMDKRVDAERRYSLEEAIAILKDCPGVKFDQTAELSLKMGLDPRKSDQQVRGTVSLPNGTGKSIAVLVFTKGDKVQEALDAGAEFAGGDELVAKVRGGWTGFDAVVATPDMMRDVGRLGKILGPRGLMPTPKTGTVTTDVGTAVREIQAGKIEFKVDRTGVINCGFGKLSFESGQLLENAQTLLSAISRAKPPGAKGQYVLSMSISSTMGPGIKVDSRAIVG